MRSHRFAAFRRTLSCARLAASCFVLGAVPSGGAAAHGAVALQTVQAPDDCGGVRTVDAACVMRKTVLALRIRLLLERWPVVAGKDSSLSSRRDSASHVFSTDSSRTQFRNVARFVMATSVGVDTVTEEDLMQVHDSLVQAYPRPLATLVAPAGPATSEAIRQAAAYYVLSPASEALAPATLSSGTGVSFQQAVLEGATAFVYDRARADLARAGLRAFHNRMTDTSAAVRSLVPTVLRRTMLIAAPEGKDDPYRDPRLYLQALQTALVQDFEALPSSVATHFEQRGGYGVPRPYWALAGRSLRLVGDVQRGTHPLAALSAFAAAPLPEIADPALQARLYELSALSAALYAGSIDAGGQRLSARSVLGTLDGRRLFAIFLHNEIRHAAGADPRATRVSRDVRALEARIVALLETLDGVVRELDGLRERLAAIQAQNPEQAASLYADYVSATTRAVRQVVAGDPSAAGVAAGGAVQEALDTIDTLLGIREAIVRRDYSGAVQSAMPMLRQMASSRVRSETWETVDRAITTAAALIAAGQQGPLPAAGRRRALQSVDQALQYAIRLHADAVALSKRRLDAIDRVKLPEITELPGGSLALSTEQNTLKTAATSAHGTWNTLDTALTTAKTATAPAQNDPKSSTRHGCAPRWRGSAGTETPVPVPMAKSKAPKSLLHRT